MTIDLFEIDVDIETAILEFRRRCTLTPHGRVRLWVDRHDDLVIGQDCQAESHTAEDWKAIMTQRPTHKER